MIGFAGLISSHCLVYMLVCTHIVMRKFVAADTDIKECHRARSERCGQTHFSSEDLHKTASWHSCVFFLFSFPPLLFFFFSLLFMHIHLHSVIFYNNTRRALLEC